MTVDTKELDARLQELDKQLKEWRGGTEADKVKLENIITRLRDIDTRLRERAVISNDYMFSKIITGTTSASAGTETTHTHIMKRNPSFVFITSQSNGVVYLTSKSTADIKVKGSVSSLNFTAYLLA